MTPAQAHAVGVALSEVLAEGDREGLVPSPDAATVTVRPDGAVLVRTYWREQDDPGHVSATLAVLIDEIGGQRWLPAMLGGAA